MGLLPFCVCGGDCLKSLSNFFSVSIFCPFVGKKGEIMCSSEDYFFINVFSENDTLWLWLIQCVHYLGLHATDNIVIKYIFRCLCYRTQWPKNSYINDVMQFGRTFDRHTILTLPFFLAIKLA